MQCPATHVSINAPIDARLRKLHDLSPYVAQQLARYPDLPLAILTGQEFDIKEFMQNIDQWLSLDEVAFMAQLRKEKHRWQCIALHRLVSAQLTQAAFLREITQLAEALIETALCYAERQLTLRYGQALDEKGNRMRLTVLGMGKLGGGELNFSSDVDLMFVYEKEGETSPNQGGKSIDFAAFFTKMAQKLIYLLDKVSAEGFVYRVDMRLRPFGAQGALVLTHRAMANYYLQHGRDWERYALMKARAVAGDKLAGAKLLERLSPFVFRRYLDYAALSALAEIKRSIAEKVRLDGSEGDIKLGRGGIREAEFAVQAMQMVYGGQYPMLRQQGFLQVLSVLAVRGLWSAEVVEELREAYLCLREVENALQWRFEQQTHLLPDKTEDWQWLAQACGFVEIQALQTRLNAARETVHRQFQAVFADNPATNPQTRQWLEALPVFDWQQLSVSDLVKWWLEKGADAHDEWTEGAAEHCVAFIKHVAWQRLSERSVGNLNRVLSMLVDLLAREAPLRAGFVGVLKLLKAVYQQGNYLALLAEQSSLLAKLLALSARSTWLMDYVCAYPVVLEAILHDRVAVECVEVMQEDMQARLSGLLDEESWLHALRDFKHAWVFRVAWCDVHGQLSLMQVSDYLTLIAELVLRCVYERVLGIMQKKHGIALSKTGRAVEFAIIGYGKLGGLEMSYDSDLDLVFLHDDNEGEGMTDGERSVENGVFFNRFVQRLNNVLSAASVSGALYEVDVRLRPEGLAGLPVSSFASFARYQREKAWTWEHQALSRARFVVGDAQLGAKFNALREEVLCGARSVDLRTEVLEMREKMRLARGAIPKGYFDVKHSAGGLIDIEFIVQFLLLKHASSENVIARMSDNIRQLAALEATGILSSTTAMELRDAYRRLRQASHAAYLAGEGKVLPEAAFLATQAKVIAHWQQIFA